MSNKALITTLASVLIVIGILASSINGAYDYFMKKVYPIKYEEYVSEYSKMHKVDPALVYAIIKTESGFSQNAKSKVGAVGLMQIMPNTFKWLQAKRGVKSNLAVDLTDPEINIDNGTYLISLLLEKYKSEQVAICAYNAGIGTVDGWLDDKNCSENGVTLSYIPYWETRQYLNKVMKTKEIYNKLYFKERR